MNKSDIFDGVYRFSTSHFHGNNQHTMSEFLDCHLGDIAEVVFVDGTYAEICCDGVLYGVHASGDGDSFNHLIRFEVIGHTEDLQ